MRIINGKYKGIKFPNFSSKDIRPTTDRSKESIFAYIENNLDITEINALDIFAGSGTISLELLSRECKQVKSVDKGKESINYLKQLKKQVNLKEEWVIEQNDVFRFIKQNNLHEFQLIFADPPYNMPSLHQLVSEILQKMETETILIVEHKPAIQFSTPFLIETKSFGKSSFSIFSRR